MRKDVESRALRTDRVEMYRVLDLFCGGGGLALGFRRAGFQVHGVDHNQWAVLTFKHNHIGTCEIQDLRTYTVRGNYDVIVGGPPCRPWSSVNLHLRGAAHPDFTLVDAFFRHIAEIQPRAFVLENVPQAAADILERFRKFPRLSRSYSWDRMHVRYSDWGAPTRRRRFFLIGFHRETGIGFPDFAKVLERKKKEPMSVRDAFRNLIPEDRSRDPENTGPNLRTIHRYRHYYETGKYGWYILPWDEPAPSFGNILKTYILHPESSFENGKKPRVLTVREALAVMGFPPDYRFPEGTPLTERYQMIADAVSPVFSRALAESIREVLQHAPGRTETAPEKPS